MARAKKVQRSGEEALAELQSTVIDIGSHSANEEGLCPEGEEQTTIAAADSDLAGEDGLSLEPALNLEAGMLLAPQAVQEQAKPAPAYIGFIDRVVKHTVDGWAMDHLDTERRLIVVATVNEEIVGRTRCDLYRQDLHDNGYGDGRYAFQLMLSRPFNPSLSFAVHVDDAESSFELTLNPGALQTDGSSDEQLSEIGLGEETELTPATIEYLDPVITIEPSVSGSIPALAKPMLELSNLQLTLNQLRQKIERLQGEVAAATASAATGSVGSATGRPLILPPPAEKVSQRARGLYLQLLSRIR